jgi:hypothetical protein
MGVDNIVGHGGMFLRDEMHCERESRQYLPSVPLLHMCLISSLEADAAAEESALHTPGGTIYHEHSCIAYVMY